ncbi:hypothetical protein QTP88_022919 [Uroleucon formosanum]
MGHIVQHATSLCPYSFRMATVVEVSFRVFTPIALKARPILMTPSLEPQPTVLKTPGQLMDTLQVSEISRERGCFPIKIHSMRLFQRKYSTHILESESDWLSGPRQMESNASIEVVIDLFATTTNAIVECVTNNGPLKT